ncbi:hypothetical protein [Helicobacter rodentium]|uniref:hypothetical protein n=1 Tax=Helicobacter rodentium TaxID=59617 RepID=UPI00235243AF|nr:hypothetical protein [Helicobacter rodentium]
MSAGLRAEQQSVRHWLTRLTLQTAGLKRTEQTRSGCEVKRCFACWLGGVWA